MKMILLALSICTWQVVLVVGQKTCEYPAVPNGHPVGKLKQFYNSGETLTLICDSTHKFDGTRYALCDDGSWILPACKPLDGKCAAPSVLNAKPQGEISAPYPAGSTVRFLCDHGFEFEGTQYALCDDGTWRLPACKRLPNHCGPPPHVENGLINGPYKDDYREQERVQYVCAERYELIGENEIQCTKGAWTSEPFCDPKDDADSDPVSQCKTPYVKDGDFIPVPGRRKFKVQCNTFYKLVGPETVRCVRRKWTELPVCKPPCVIEESGKYLMEGERKKLSCGGTKKKFVTCVNGELEYGECRIIWHWE